MKKVDVVAKFIQKNSGKLFLVGILLFILTSLGLKNLQSDFSFRVWFKKDDPAIVYYNNFEQTFGNEDKIILLVHHPDGLFTNKNINLIQEITKKFELLPQVTGVDSLTTFDVIESVEDEILVGPLFDFESQNTINLSPTQMSTKKEDALNHRILKGFIVSENGKTTSIFGTLKPVFEENPNYLDTFNKLELLQKELKSQYPEMQFHITGTAGTIEYYREAVTKDLSVIFPVILISVILIMFLLFRNFSVIGMAFSIILTTIMSTLGIGALIGVKVNPLTSMIPCILIAICLADAIHILATYAKLNTGNVQDTIRKTVKKNFIPTLFTTITTIIGFSSFAFTKIAPISELGILTSIGTALAWAYTYTLLPWLLSIRGKKIRNIQKEKKINLSSYILKLDRYKVAIFSLFLLVFTYGITTLNKVDIDNNSTKMFKKSHPMVQALDFATENLGVAKEINIVFYKKDLGDLYDSKSLLLLENLQTNLEKLPFVTKTQSMVNIIQETNESLLGKGHFRVPEDRKRIAENLFLYELSSSSQNNLYRFISRDGEMMRMNIVWMSSGSKEVSKNLAIVKDEMDKLGIKGHITGKVPLLTSQNVEVINTFIESLMISLCLITLFIMWHLKSIRLGLIALIPNVLPLIIISIMMSKLGISLNAGTVLVASISLGIAVDDTIHFFDSFKNNFSETGDIKASIRAVFEGTGKAIVTTTTVLVVCFCAFFAGKLQLNHDFGLLTSTCLIFALLADLVVVPALFLLLGKSLDEVPTTAVVAEPEAI
ncbi:MAG: MMPL family transporter [Bacteriovoracaceae bacterium]|nr:MMPL family transporter [Bacteriovoracaceae bacterium]